MFFKYTWNNFLHTQVEICIALILASPFENTENSTITDQDSTGDSLLLKHVSSLGVFLFFFFFATPVYSIFPYTCEVN